MAVLHLLLEHNTVVRSIPELASVCDKNRWVEEKKFLLVPYHMIGSRNMESAIFGGYVDHVQEAHPGERPRREVPVRGTGRRLARRMDIVHRRSGTNPGDEALLTQYMDVTVHATTSRMSGEGAAGTAGVDAGKRLLEAERVKRNESDALARRDGAEFVPLAALDCGVLSPRFNAYIRNTLKTKAAGTLGWWRRRLVATVIKQTHKMGSTYVAQAGHRAGMLANPAYPLEEVLPDI